MTVLHPRAEHPADTSAEPVARFLEALESREFDALRSTLADDLWFRALLPRRVLETRTAEEAVAVYAGWFAHARWIEAEHRPSTGRELLRYRWRSPSEEPPHPWRVAEQNGYCKVQDGRIRRLDVVCTGLHPV